MKKIFMIIICLVLLNLSACKNQNKSSQDFCLFLINDTRVYNEQIDHIEMSEVFPDRYDLREYGIVTPVKNQNPWQSCWGFSAIAASETSILNDLGKTYNETELDLSELQLLWFSKSHINNVDDEQNGEGIYCDGNNNPLTYPGSVYTATSIFSSGIGVISEESLPYKGKNGNTDGSIYNYSSDDDWSVDESFHFLSGFEIEESNILPCPVIRDKDEKYCGYNEYGTYCIKKELLRGRAVSICFHADNYLPNTNVEPKYINTNNNKWAHYTYDDSSYNHAVTIVGYDDSISKYDFIDHTNEKGEAFIPEGDGAWICKNSWGAETETFPNYGKWGIKNNNGLSTGYFYLSYYDHSLYAPESFKFQAIQKQQDFIIEQYDYLQSKDQECWYCSNIIKMANVFYSKYDEYVYAVSCETGSYNADVSIQIFRLEDDYRNPEDGELIYSNDINYEYAGYHRIELKQPINMKKNQSYSVVVSEKFSVDNNDYYGVFVDRQYSKEYLANDLDQKSNNQNDLIYGIGIVNPNESFIYIEDLNGWCDWHNIIEEFKKTPLRNYTFDNFPIKTYSDFNE